MLDECMPYPLIERLADLPHLFEHAARIGLAGLANGDSLGIIFVRIAPCVTDLVAPPLRALLTSEPQEKLIGRRIVRRREDWEIIRIR